MRSTFSNGGEYASELKTIQEGLYTKSWLIHCLTILSRVVYPLLGIARWQLAYKGRERTEEVNQEFADMSEKYIKTTIIVLIPLGALLDILCLWRRELSRL